MEAVNHLGSPSALSRGREPAPQSADQLDARPALGAPRTPSLGGCSEAPSAVRL